MTLPSSVTQKTEVFYGSKNVMDTVQRFTTNTLSRIDACVDYTRPSLAIEFEELKKLFIDAKRRGAKFRYVTEIGRENIHYCKELLKMVDELRHLEGIKGNFYVSDSEYIAPARYHERGKPATQIIYSISDKEIGVTIEKMEGGQIINSFLLSNEPLYLKHFASIFDELWKNGIEASERIRDIEQGNDSQDIEII